MDIYLKEKSNSSSRFRFPSLPESIKVTNSASCQSYDILGKGVVKVPRGMENGSITWNAVFFGRAKRNESIIRKWTAPSECKKILNNWMENGTVLNLLVTETNINFDVTINSFEYTECGAYGNAEYSISFSIYKELKIYTTEELKLSSEERKTKARPAPEPPKTYTVVKGDNLWKIARRFYGGSGSSWRKIYDANKEVIESTARRYGKASSDNGHWIYPGETFTIP